MVQAKFPDAHATWSWDGRTKLLQTSAERKPHWPQTLRMTTIILIKQTSFVV